MKKYYPSARFRRLFFAQLAIVFLSCSMLLPAAAQAMTSISQSYTSSAELSQGSIVSLKKDSSDEVVASSTATADGMLGVVINSGNALLTLSNSDNNQVQVATSGTTQVLVSDYNGPIKEGDHITASPITGVGMKASDNVRIIGIAQSDMSGGTKQSYKDKKGASHETTVGMTPVLVNVAYFFKEPEKTVIPTALQNVANGLAGKKVDSLPIIISGAIFLVMLIIVVSIIYAMIRSSIVSVGRNPMSQSAVYRDLIQMSILVLGILTVGVVAIYLILTKL